MKRNAILALVALLLLPVLALGCGGGETSTLELTYDDFTAQAHIVRDIEITRPAKLSVSLYANPTTGYQWAESANITNPGVMAQASHKYLAPQTNLVGAGGKDVWTFNAKEAGTTAISFSYGRPWAGGEKDTWTVTLNVTVK